MSSKLYLLTRPSYMSSEYLAFMERADAETAARRLGSNAEGEPIVLEINLVRSMKGMTMTKLHELLDDDVL